MEMSYCYEKGIRHSDFLEWSEEDRAKTLAYMVHESEKCSLCGTAGWEWEENRFAYDPVLRVCQGCQRKQMHAESLGKTPPGTTVELTRLSPQQLAKQQMDLQRMAKLRREEKEGTAGGGSPG